MLPGVKKIAKLLLLGASVFSSAYGDEALSAETTNLDLLTENLLQSGAPNLETANLLGDAENFAVGDAEIGEGTEGVWVNKASKLFGVYQLINDKPLPLSLEDQESALAALEGLSVQERTTLDAYDAILLHNGGQEGGYHAAIMQSGDLNLETADFFGDAENIALGEAEIPAEVDDAQELFDVYIKSLPLSLEDQELALDILELFDVLSVLIDDAQELFVVYQLINSKGPEDQEAALAFKALSVQERTTLDAYDAILLQEGGQEGGYHAATMQ